LIVIIIVYNEDGNGFTFFRHVKNLFIKHVSRWHADYDRKWRGLSALYVMFSPLLYNCPKHTLLDAHGMMDEYNYTNIIQIFTYASDDLWVYIPIFFSSCLDTISTQSHTGVQHVLDLYILSIYDSTKRSILTYFNYACVAIALNYFYEYNYIIKHIIIILVL